MERRKLNFILDKDLERELAYVKRAIRGLGEESYLSFSRLSKESGIATRYMNENAQQQIENLLQVIQILKTTEAAQESLLQKLKEGGVSSREYAQAQTDLANQQAELKLQIADLNIQLEQEIQLSLQSTSAIVQKTNALFNLAKAYAAINQQKLLGDFPGDQSSKGIQQLAPPPTTSHGDLPSGKEIYELKNLLKSNPEGLAILLGYEGLTGGVKKSGKFSKLVDVGTTFAGTYLDSFKNMFAYAGSSLYNLFSGEWKNALEDYGHSLFPDFRTFSDAIDASIATFNQYDLEQQVALNTDLMNIDNNQLLEYCKILRDGNVSLRERQRLLEEMIELENENYNTQSRDLTAEYKTIFLNKNKRGYARVKSKYKDDLSLLENYFEQLNEGKSLNYDEQIAFSTSLNRIQYSDSLIWDNEVKEQFVSFFRRAIQNNGAHQQMLRLINNSYEQGNSGGQLLDETKSIPVGFTPLPAISLPTSSFPLFDPEPLRQEMADKKQLYQEDINGYIAYLQGKIAAAKQNPLPEGKEEENILNRELASAERTKDNRLESLLSQYQGYTTKMTSLATSYQAEMALLNQAMKDASTETERQRIEEAIDMRTDGYTASLVNMEAENEGFSKVLFGDLRNISKEALNQAIAEARDFIAQWSANAGELSPETEKVVRKIQEGIEKAETSLNETGGKKDDFAMADHFRDAAAALQGCADLAYVFDESLGDVIQTAADVAQGAADIAAGVASFSANPLQGATSILGGVTKIVGSLGKRMQENEKIRQEYLQGLVETYSKELEYNSVLRERLRIQQQLGETSLDYFNRLQAELGKQQGDINREYTEVWNKLMKEQYISGTGYKHGTWLRKAKTWNEYDSLAGKSYEEIESLYTQDKLEGSAKTLFERLRELKEEGADVVEMMDQLNEEMKESWTGTTTSAITDSIVQGFLDGKRSAADFADTFEDMMKTAMMQSVKMKYLEGPLEEWYAKFAEASEGGLTEEKIAELRRQYEQIVANAAREAENMEAITGLGASAEAARQATAQGIASMSQETASELNGNFYALQYLTSNIDRNVTNIQSVLYQASDQWIRIEENTRYCRKLETMEKDMSAIRKDMQDINNKGILMRTR